MARHPIHPTRRPRMFDDVPFASALNGPERPDSGWLFVVRGDRVLVSAGETPQFPAAGAFGLPEAAGVHYLGRLRERHCWAVRLAADTRIPGFELTGLRRLFSRVPDELLAIAGRAVQIVEWDETHRFCGRCGEPMHDKAGERARECPSCRHVCYPRVAPAMMALVRRGESLLLARAPRFKGGMYSALAGFVEPGESLEQCVRREVREEVGIEVTNLRYFASQAWPFPHSLMVAFNADWAAGELAPDPAEIADARWFDLDALPELPGPVSIARRLIDAGIAAMRAERAGRTR